MKDPFRQLEILQQALSSDKNRIAFLLGAGCPVSIRTHDGGPLIPNIEGLTNNICLKLKNKKIDRIKSRIQLPANKSATIEDVLTHVRLLIEVVGCGNIDDFNKIDLEALEKEICSEISTAVSQDLPNSETPYHKLASWIQGIPRNNAVEIFTPNYDLLIESALESKRIPYFDGFIGSIKAYFDLHAIEHETLPSRWVKLWKLHGSINWWNDRNHNVFRSHSESGLGKQMIFPSHLKYDQSRRMPYLAMQDRLGHFLATGQAILVVCGYSFADQHLNSIIMQRLSANPRAICFGLLFDELENYHEAIECAQKTTNLTLLAKDGTYIGGQRKGWDTKDTSIYNTLSFCVERIPEKEGNEFKVNCTIGNFKILGEFLLNQIEDTSQATDEVGHEN
jgi:hypothetical protein